MKKPKIDTTSLPIYEIMIDESDKTGIRLLSLVEKPAIEVLGMYFSDVDIEKEIEYAFKNVEEKQIVVGPALIPNKKILRKDESGNFYYCFFSKDTICKMVSKFNKYNNNTSINVDHSNTMVDGFILSNWIIEDPTFDKSRYYGFNLPVGSWFVEVKINDTNFWNTEVKGNKKYGFSIEGLLDQVLTDDRFNEVSEIIESLTDDEVLQLFDGLPIVEDTLMNLSIDELNKIKIWGEWKKKFGKI